MPDIPTNFSLPKVVFYGRTIDEYRLFLDLDLPALKGKKVLDCPSGAASFTASARKLGIISWACDPLFAQSLARLHQTGRTDIATVMRKVRQTANDFNWEAYDNLGPAELLRRRRLALELFSADIKANGHHYICTSLPKLPFASHSFDLVLSGHFLFTYSNLAQNPEPFGYHFHLAAIREMIRVSKNEVRIYPLRGLTALPYPRLDELCHSLEQMDCCRCQVVKVPFQFQRGSNQMLKINAKAK